MRGQPRGKQSVKKGIWYLGGKTRSRKEKQKEDKEEGLYQ